LRAEVQSEIPQVVQFIDFLDLAPSPQPEEAKGEESRHLVEALGWGHEVGMEGTGHRRSVIDSDTAP
jgi:hypothetical protein